MKSYRYFLSMLCLIGVCLSVNRVYGAVQINPNPGKQPKVVQIQYHKNWTYSSVELDASPIANDETEYIKWDENAPGYWKADSCFGNVLADDYYFFWNDRVWDSSGIGVSWGLVARGRKSEVCGVRDYHSDEYSYTAPTDWQGEHGSGKQSRIIHVDTLQPCEQTKQTVTRKTHTRYELRTGGKKAGGKKNLFVLTALAENHANLFHPEIEDNPVSTPIAYTSIALGDLGKLGGDGRLYKALGDGETRNVTPTVEGSRYYRFGQPDATKHKSRFEIFVRQPYPNYPNDAGDYGPDGPPFGYPAWSVSDNAGHAWWKLSTDAPIDAVNNFTTTNCSRWLGQELGYGPINTTWEWSSHNITGPGELPFPYSKSPTVNRSYEIGFWGLIGGLVHTEGVHENAGTWNSRWHNCVHEVILTGIRAGVPLPNDWLPESFGFHLPPSDP